MMQITASRFKPLGWSMEACYPRAWWIVSFLLVAFLSGSVDANIVALDREQADRLEGRQQFSQLAYLADPMTATDKGYTSPAPRCGSKASAPSGDDGVGLQIHGGLTGSGRDDAIPECEVGKTAPPHGAGLV